jgi:hypothetical protein
MLGKVNFAEPSHKLSQEVSEAVQPWNSLVLEHLLLKERLDPGFWGTIEIGNDEVQACSSVAPGAAALRYMQQSTINGMASTCLVPSRFLGFAIFSPRNLGTVGNYN